MQHSLYQSLTLHLQQLQAMCALDRLSLLELLWKLKQFRTPVNALFSTFHLIKSQIRFLLLLQYFFSPFFIQSHYFIYFVFNLSVSQKVTFFCRRNPIPSILGTTFFKNVLQLVASTISMSTRKLVCLFYNHVTPCILFSSIMFLLYPFSNFL